MPSLEKQPVVMLSTDASVGDATSDTARRMQVYTELYASVHVILSAPTPLREVREVLPRVFVHPVPYRSKLLGLLRVSTTLGRVVRKIRPGSIITQDPFLFGLVGLLVGKHFHIPMVAGVFGTDIHNVFIRTESLKHRFYTLLAPHVLKRADAIQTDGPETVERLKEEYGKKVFFKPMMPTDLDALQTLSRNLSESPFRILFMGRFVLQKNIPLLLEIIDTTKRATGNGVRFTIVGKGRERAWFEQQVHRRGLDGVCDMRGVVSRHDIVGLFSSHHVLLLPSRYEGFPRVFMEAAVAGMPVIAAEVGGIKGLVMDEKTGYVLSQEAKSEAYAEKITHLSSHRDVLEGFSRNIKEAFQKEYGGKTVLDYQRPLVEFVSSRR
ncbi:MAG: glycosyltransferase [Patescibacteria group bacterium]